MKSPGKTRILLLAGLIGFTAYNAAAFELPARGICAHRGANSSHPENTLAAFREAIRIGAHMIEFDVQLSYDSALVIIHDDTVDRTTNGKGRVADLTLAELKKLDAGSWKDPKFSEEKIPTLSEVLAIMPKNIWLNIHIKEDETNAFILARGVAARIAQNKQWHQAVVACKTGVRMAIEQIDDRIMICNMERRDDPVQYVYETIIMKASFIQLKTRADNLLAGLIKNLKDNAIRINYFGIGSGPEKSLYDSTMVTPQIKLRQLFAAGVEFPLVDDPASMIEVCRETGIEPAIAEY